MSKENLSEFIKGLSDSISKEYGIPEVAINKIIITTIHWFILKIDESKDSKEWFDSFSNELKTESIKMMFEELNSEMRSKIDIDSIMKYLSNKK